ncbi:hypothetical protein BLNAU_22891 [Blattamonas nauphoetae]|uniref:Uncharacterized protein n=1 Tax=Blattamonas nauphoetae TaxID=2049346 RepID=A0ABQ9WS87_9EUKA|nr:hypothetical protein BLNAU_24351 [Blattamonas nauphoetae]KAK2942193.1 hypothetical protein BLNAU_22876 [Blattamonas nauphoetae]KAK2942208.1 hypothetical protein BLNAU_22891 [Blattamonas nauphoetae]
MNRSLLTIHRSTKASIVVQQMNLPSVSSSSSLQKGERTKERESQSQCQHPESQVSTTTQQSSHFPLEHKQMTEFEVSVQHFQNSKEVQPSHSQLESEIQVSLSQQSQSLVDELQVQQ